MKKSDSASVIVLPIMLALIVKAALEALLKPIAEGKMQWVDTSPIVWAQVFVFLILTLRFYVGALRFIETEPKKADFAIRFMNFVFAFVLFCAFYAAALAAVQSEFLTIIVALHAIDLVWFLIALVVSYFKYVPDEELARGEIMITSMRKVIIKFIALSSVTLIVTVALYYNGLSLVAPVFGPLYWAFLASILVISVADFAMLWKYYFSFEQWKKENSRTAVRRKKAFKKA